MRRPVRSWVLAGLAAGLVGTAAPIPAAHAEPAFGGYSAEAVATPLKIEIYEPVLPIPAQPQLEFELAYTKVEATSGDGVGLASWLWPGDPVGQGCKTFVEQLGFGFTGACKDGYPVQVNSRTPGGPDEASDEPVPGSRMRTSADPTGVRATVGWSSDSDVSDKESSEGAGPSLPGAPGGDAPSGPVDPLKTLTDLGDAITGKNRAASSSAAAEEDDGAGAPGLPPELAALVDVDGLVSESRTMLKGGTVHAVATSKLGQLSLLGGIITAEGITVRSTTTTDGKKPTASGVTRIGGLSIAGTPVRFGRDGIELAGRKQTIPGLSDDPGKALEQLGVQLLLPRPTRSAKGDEAESAYEGLQVVIDTAPLRSLLKDVPLSDLISSLPTPEQAAPLKNLLGAAAQLAPKFVITAGNAATETSTVPKMVFDLPTVDPDALTGAGAPPTGAAAGSASGAAGTGSGSAAAGAPTTGEAAAAGSAGDGGDVGALAAQPMSSGLPPLASIPGALMVGGLLLAAGLGWWLQKIGGLVLGGAGSCSHGLETGVPDLRRA